MLTITDLTYRIAGRTLLGKVSLSIPAGHRVGLVGPNGTGKSTLFKLISGELSSDGGEISLIRGASMGMVRQDLPDDETTLVDVVLAADTERAALLKEAETAEDPERIGYIYERLDAIRAYEAPSRASTILAGLGFNEAAQNSPISSFSGGWRARVALAAALFREPNLLLLDEPHQPSRLRGDGVAGELPAALPRDDHHHQPRPRHTEQDRHAYRASGNQKLVNYTGNYDQFERRRAERMMGQQAMHDKQQKQKAKMMEFVNRFKAKASKARQAQSRLKMIEKMDIVDAVMADRVTAFTFPEPEELKSPLITLEDVEAGYQKASRYCASSTCASTRMTASRCWARTATANRHWLSSFPAGLPRCMGSC